MAEARRRPPGKKQIRRTGPAETPQRPGLGRTGVSCPAGALGYLSGAAQSRDREGLGIRVEMMGKREVRVTASVPSPASIRRKSTLGGSEWMKIGEEEGGDGYPHPLSC